VVDELMKWEQGAGAAGQAKTSTPPSPHGLVRQAVRYEAALEPPRSEWFLAGTEQSHIVRAAASPPANLIASPIDGTVLALDPDIPPASQRLRLAPARPLSAGWRWRLDGRVLGSATPRHVPPWPGRHRLELVAPNGSVREAVAFEVRGARVRGAERRMAQQGQGPTVLIRD
jgi:penicillin-binding protein 1C